MKTKIKILSVFALAVMQLPLMAQDKKAKPNVLDGIYIREHVPARRVVPYAHLREADVMWLKRVWRTIDMRQKINQTLYYPTKPINDRQNLYDVIKDALLVDGTLTAYDPGPLQDDEFTMPMTVDEVKGKLFSTDTVWITNLEGEMEQKIQTNEVLSATVKWYDVKEEWFFDNQRSVMDVRIIGMAPLIEQTNDLGEVIGKKTLFWIYYPEARYVYANAAVFNRSNDSERRTYEDIFWKRQFDSYITKESNRFDRFIVQYKQGLDALLEAERIKEEIFNIEHDVWHF